MRPCPVRLLQLTCLASLAKVAYRDLPVVGPYHPKGQPDLSTAEFPADRATDALGWTELSGVYRAPARACENHAYVVSSTYCDVSRDWMISGIYGQQGEVLAQATQRGSVAVAEVDLDSPTIWGNIGDYKAQLLRHRPPTADEQVAAAIAQTKPAAKSE